MMELSFGPRRQGVPDDGCQDVGRNLELPFMLGGPRCSALEEEFDHFHPLFPTVLHNWRLLHGICAGQFVMAVR
jgi:hypothetical protein